MTSRSLSTTTARCGQSQALLLKSSFSPVVETHKTNDIFQSGQVKAEASWDSTIHECSQLSRGGMWPEQRVYLTVRVVVQLSHPADMQLVLRKRICVSVNPCRQGFAHTFLRRMSTRSTIPGCGVTFEVVSNIPEVGLGQEWAFSLKCHIGF